MIKNLEINHLKTLKALFEFGSLSRASEHLRISQQAVSSQLKKIRELVGDNLFVRTGHGVAPTNYARLIEPQVYRVLTLLNEIPAPNDVDLKNVHRTLVISATDYTQKIILSELLDELRNHAPKTRLVVTNIESATLTQKMHQGEIDLAFTSEGYVPEGLEAVSLFTEKYLCVTTNKKPSSAGVLSLDELVSYGFIITSPGVGGLKGSADYWFEKQGFQRDVVISVPSFFMAKEYLKKTDAVGFIPSRLLPEKGLSEIFLEKYPPGYEVVAAFHPGARHDPLLNWLIDKLTERFRNQ
ncbi:LysR family transcriptional regulator [Microbulbifer sp. OS29]|uniref:LysR family transcriptional regulator n=1 Tax=Microbulbifer okhotskensis TaxID=2926617 RepID=A0A9X2EML3_9GAMM|nr:LysR family transcriptional regulator [Microbulbifer okhotskensis]MCO1335029.1 LysR family transcriptional regulator [Microbulbifer okhotskensis]